MISYDTNKMSLRSLITAFDKQCEIWFTSFTANNTIIHVTQVSS